MIRQLAALEAVNFVLTVVFVLEMLLKLAGLGCRGYLNKAMNCFDAFIVIISVLEIISSPPLVLQRLFKLHPTKSLVGGGGTSALRAVRVLRLFKLARNWRDLQVLLMTMAKSLQSAANFSLLMLLFVFIYTLVGMQFFANRLHFDITSGEHVALSEVISRYRYILFFSFLLPLSLPLSLSLSLSVCVVKLCSFLFVSALSLSQ